MILPTLRMRIPIHSGSRDRPVGLMIVFLSLLTPEHFQKGQAIFGGFVVKGVLVKHIPGSGSLGLYHTI